MTPRERLFALEQFGIKLGLHNITMLLAALNQPHHSFASVHVAGTNGKGSVTAMVERGLRAPGVTTGRYTSPHLDRIEERVAVNGAAVDATVFDAVAVDVLAAIDRLHDDGGLETMPTFFEATTALAFEVFRRQAVKIAVIEVGLGGRFDATNVIVPIVSVITSIAFDHERHLGSTLAQIAFEKAGIIKSGVPLICGVLPDEARAVVAQIATDKAAPMVEAAPAPARGGVPIRLALHGAHQAQNAAVAVATLKACAAHGVPVEQAHLIAALSDVEWPARLEWLRTAGGDVLIDAAHNPAGAQALADYVTLSAAGPLPVVLAVMKDKDVATMVRALAPVATRFIATQAASPRALEAHALADRIAAAVPGAQVTPVEDADDAVRAALVDCGRAIAAGSIFLVGPLRARLIRQGAVPVRYPSTTPFFLN
jgi:dihydrofolate synthase/folylpolyglutamate synthase